MVLSLATALGTGEVGKDWGIERESYQDPVTAVRVWEIETATGKQRLLVTGLRDTVRQVHAHPSFDRLGRYVQFHSGRTHETVALVDLEATPVPSSSTPPGEPPL